MLSAGQEEVHRNLADYPHINYVQGLIPQVLQMLPAQLHYRLVHIDVDLIEPTLGAMKYFYPVCQREG